MRASQHIFARLFLLCLCGWLHLSASAQTVEYLHTDVLGSPVVRTGDNGQITGDFRYSAYGRTLSSSGVAAPIGYAGAAFDAESNFIYLHRRYYDPRVGRFLGVDPIAFRVEDPQSFNVYAYANNNPYRYTDPDGRNVLSVMDWKDFGQDVGQLLVDEMVYGIAKLHGNEAVAHMAIEAMIEHRMAAAASTAGVMSPVPRSGQAIKRAGNMMEMAGDASGGASKAARGADSAANRTSHEKYLESLREQMSKPEVQDPRLAELLGKLYRENAKIGSGSTAAAVRHERATGEKIGEWMHSQKAENMIEALEKWLRTDGPQASPGDRAAAENVILDMRKALGQ